MTDLRPGLTVLVACHPERLSNGLVVETFASIARQTLQPDTIIVVNDLERAGAGRTRQKLLRLVETTWLTWIDSDDLMLPTHLEKLWNHAQETGAVFVNSWFYAPGDPLGHYGKKLDPCNPHHTTITFMARTDISQEVGFPETQENWPVSNEDLAFIFGFAKLCCERGLIMSHLAERSWRWRQEGQNSSGKIGQGDAGIDVRI